MLQYTYAEVKDCLILDSTSFLFVMDLLTAAGRSLLPGDAKGFITEGRLSKLPFSETPAAELLPSTIITGGPIMDWEKDAFLELLLGLWKLSPRLPKLKLPTTAVQAELEHLVPTEAALPLTLLLLACEEELLDKKLSRTVVPGKIFFSL